MARDDYNIVVYKILTYLYKCVKEGKEPDINNVITAENYGISEGCFDYIMAEMVNEGYIRGVSVSDIQGKIQPCVKITRGIIITPKGIEYLHKYLSVWRVKDLLKDLKEAIHLL